jgi:F-type H+-transporting ATPase subunit alpha
MAQTRVMKKVAGRLRIDLAQYHEMSQFVKFGAEVDQATLDQLTRGEREREVLKQDQHNPLPLEKQIVILYAAVNGYLDAVPVEHVKEYEQALFTFMASQYPVVLPGIGQLKDLSEDTEKILVKAVSRFTGDFLRQRTESPALTPVT